MPSFTQRAGTTQTRSQPSVTQAKAERASAQDWPPSSPFAAQATAKRGIAASANQGRAPWTIQPSAIAASGGTAISASQVRNLAEAEARAIPPITTTIESGSTSAHQRPPKRLSRGIAVRRPGSATRTPWTALRKPIESQKGSNRAPRDSGGAGARAGGRRGRAAAG